MAAPNHLGELMLKIGLIQARFAHVAPIQDEARLFYARLFEIAPQVRCSRPT